MAKHSVEAEEWLNFEEDKSNAGRLELVIGGDHEKGSCTLIASKIVWFSNYQETEILYLECGRLEHHQDKLELEKC